MGCDQLIVLETLQSTLAHIIDEERQRKIITSEFHENALRKAFRTKEAVEIKRIIEPKIEAEAKERQ